MNAVAIVTALRMVVVPQPTAVIAVGAVAVVAAGAVRRLLLAIFQRRSDKEAIAGGPAVLLAWAEVEHARRGCRPR